MRKNLFVLPDGREIYSGHNQNPYITSVSHTQMVNDATDLDYGAACAGMIEAALLDTSGAFSISAGDELTYYSVAEDGSRTLVGHFTTEAPTKPSANTCKFTAYDRMIRFDKDLSMWLASLTEWPYTMTAFLSMVCEQCGVELADGVQLLNGDFPIMQFIQQVTGRQLIKWIAGANAAFASITPEGKLTFSTYTDAGDLGLAVKSLKLADYSTTPIARVAVKQHEDDIGVSWPENSDRKLEIVMGSNGSINYDRYFDDYYIGKISYEMDYRIELNGCTDVDPNVFVVRGVNAAGARASILNVKVYISDSGMTFGTYDAGGENPISTVCEEGRTYRVKAVLDSDTDTYDLYIDGQQVIKGRGLRCDAAAFNGIRLVVHRSGGSTAPRIYCDNITVAGQYTPVFAEDFSNGISKWSISNISAFAGVNSVGQLEVKLGAGHTSSTNCNLQETFVGNTKTAIQFDLKINGDLGTTFEAGLLLRNSETNKTAVNVGVLQGKLMAQYGGTNASVMPGKAYTVNVVTNPETSTIDVYLDGALVAGGVAYTNGQTTWDTLRFSVKGNNGTNTLSACFDNLTVAQAGESLQSVYFSEDFSSESLDGWTHTGSLPDGVYIAVKSEGDTYSILGNPLLATPSTAHLQAYVERIARRVTGLSYTPAEVQLLDPDGKCQPGAYITVTDRYGKTHRTAVFSVRHQGSVSTVKSTGNHSRSSAGAVNGQDAVKVLQGRVAKIRVDLEEVSTDLSQTTIDLNSVKNEQSSIKQTVDGITSRVSQTETTTSGLQSKYTVLEQTADDLTVSVSSIRTEVGTKAEQAQVNEIAEKFRFAEDGLTITNSGTGMGVGISEKRVIFTGGSDPTTVITPNAMETTNLKVGVQLDVGGFSWIPRSNNNLSLRWTGGK